ncbi:MAG: hypothetical protein M3Z18_08000 [Gemmatimonadota bacterium]|nr:hypothetical protein [Gemmatimonadota bacterium]
MSAGTTNPRRKILSTLFRVALLASAFLVLRRELDGLGLDDLVANVRGYGLPHLALGLAFTIASFLTLGLFELLALRYVGKRAERIVPRRTAFATAFVAHAYSQSVGLAILTGAAVRIRSYSRYGLNALDVTRLSVFVTVTATLGLLATGSLAFLTTPGRVRFFNAALSLAPFGILLLLPVVAYCLWGTFGRSDFLGRGRWRIRRPSLGLALKQIGVSSLDWVFAGAVLFLLLPRTLHISFSAFLGVYLIAQTAAVISHVPGGVGVFEAIVLALLAGSAEGRAAPPGLSASMVASLLVYRTVYYLLPLCGAIALSGIAELIRTRRPLTSSDDAPMRVLRANLGEPDAI